MIKKKPLRQKDKNKKVNPRPLVPRPVKKANKKVNRENNSEESKNH